MERLVSTILSVVCTVISVCVIGYLGLAVILNLLRPFIALYRWFTSASPGRWHGSRLRDHAFPRKGL